MRKRMAGFCAIGGWISVVAALSGGGCGGGERSATEYCADLASARCDRLQECLGPEGLAQNGLPLTKEECVARLERDLGCDALSGATLCGEERAFQPSEADACIAGLETASCSEFRDLSFGVEACGRICERRDQPDGGPPDAPAGSQSGAFYLTWEFRDASNAPLTCDQIGATDVTLTVRPEGGGEITDDFFCGSHDGTSRLWPYGRYSLEIQLLDGFSVLGEATRVADLTIPIVDLGNFVWQTQ